MPMSVPPTLARTPRPAPWVPAPISRPPPPPNTEAGIRGGPHGYRAPVRRAHARAERRTGARHLDTIGTMPQPASPDPHDTTRRAPRSPVTRRRAVAGGRWRARAGGQRRVLVALPKVTRATPGAAGSRGRSARSSCRRATPRARPLERRDPLPGLPEHGLQRRPTRPPARRPPPGPGGPAWPPAGARPRPRAAPPRRGRARPRRWPGRPSGRCRQARGGRSRSRSCGSGHRAPHQILAGLLDEPGEVAGRPLVPLAQPGPVDEPDLALDQPPIAPPQFGRRVGEPPRSGWRVRPDPSTVTEVNLASQTAWITS